MGIMIDKATMMPNRVNTEALLRCSGRTNHGMPRNDNTPKAILVPPGRGFWRYQPFEDGLANQTFM